MSKRVGAVLLSCLLFLPAVSALAAPFDNDAGKASARQPDLYRGSKIIGSTVRNADEKKIGVIKDLVLDPQRGEVAYAVVSFGGVMGVGEKYHAVPWRALSPGNGGRHYVLIADKQTIAGAPGFDKGKWPDMADQKWSAEVEQYWSRMVGNGTAGNNRLSTPGVSGQAAPASGR